MPHVESRAYQNGLVIRAKYSKGGIWNFSGDGKPRGSSFPGWTREKAHRRGDELGGAEPKGDWEIDNHALQAGDIGPCVADGCHGEMTYHLGADPNRQGTGVAGGRAIYGHCNACEDHFHVARILPDE